MRSLVALVLCTLLGCPQPAATHHKPANPDVSVSVEVGPDGAKVETKK